MNKIKVGAVSYLNTKPLIYGVKRSSALLDKMELVEDFPAHIGQMLVDGNIDIGLVPVAVIPKLKEWQIVSDYCIGASGPVASVCIFSEVPVEQVQTVLLDYQSKTSVNLARVLLKHYWKLDVTFVEADENYREKIKGTTAGVVIGDRAFEQRHLSAYMYDLAEAWINFTGLPFVFAAWVANKKLPDDFIAEFNAANAVGLHDIEPVIDSNPYTLYDLHTYFTKNISYELTEEKKQGLEKFLGYLSML